MDETISIVLFSGTDDKLQSASVLVGGAAALGKPVKILLQYWALEAFRADRIKADHGLAPEAGEAGRAALDAAAKAGGSHRSGGAVGNRPRRRKRASSSRPTRSPSPWRPRTTSRTA